MASLAKTGIFSTINVMYGAVVAFATTLVVSHLVGDAGAGEFFKVVAMFAIATSLVVFGADTALVRSVSAAVARGRGDTIKGLLGFAMKPVVVLSLLLTVLAFLVTLPEISPQMGENQRLMYRVSAPFILVSALLMVFFGLLRGLKKITLYTFAQNVLLPSLRLLAILGLFLLWSGPLSLALAWALPLCLVFVLVFFWSQKQVRLALEVANLPQQAEPTSHEEVKALHQSFETRSSFWSFALARGFAAVVEQILEWLDVLLVTAFLGLAAGGIYGAVNRCVRIGVLVEHTGRIVTGPSISGALATNNSTEASSIFTATTRVLVLVAWPFYLTLAFFGKTILGAFGENFEAAAPVLWVICPAMMCVMAAGGVQSVLLMSGKSRWQLYNKLSALLTAVFLNLLLIPRLGLIGAGIAWASSVLVDAFLATWQVANHTGIRARLNQMLPAILLASTLPGLSALVCIYLLGDNLLALCVHFCVFLPVYLGLAYLFRQAIRIDTFWKRQKKTSPAQSDLAS